MGEIKVQKRDGSAEDWIYDKLLTSIVKSGVTLEEAEVVAGQVEEWVINNSKEGNVMSEQIRDKVIEILKISHPVAADSYQAFKKE